MAPTTLYAVFNPQATWPTIPDAVTDTGRKAHISGKTTERTAPPKYHESRPLNDYTAAGQAAVAAVQADLQQHYMPSGEDLFAHRAEADVVRSAALYLLHPVNMALNFRSPLDYKCFSEFKANTVRSDVVFIRRADNGVGVSCFAVLEFKNRGVLDLHRHPWDQTLTSGRNTGALLTQQVLASNAFGGNINLVVGNAPENDAEEMTYFDGNPLILVKQAALYAIKYKTKYVALFDWNTLILIYFNNLDIVGEYCGDGIRTTIIRNRGEMRLALMGFLELAISQP